AVLFDFVEHVHEALVFRRDRGVDRPCVRIDVPGPTTGGLQHWPIETAPRQLCDQARPWLWVGATTVMDLELRPRRCVTQHPQGSEPIITRYEKVPISERLVVYGGLWWERERWRNGGDVVLVVRLDGEAIGRMVHRDGEGWKRIEITLPPERVGSQGRIDFEVSAEWPDFRAFCWAASMRRMK
ncbi:MAG: hypothetical protein N2515_00760, partial [Deltaproteobacteria bacterium]|nr:hypothetical protein [Deltaproteobacteria bacterium]